VCVVGESTAVGGDEKDKESQGNGEISSSKLNTTTPRTQSQSPTSARGKSDDASGESGETHSARGDKRKAAFRRSKKKSSERPEKSNSTVTSPTELGPQFNSLHLMI